MPGKSLVGTLRSPRLLAPVAVALGTLTGAAIFRRFNRYNLVHRNAIVTGGSRGLGLEIARVLVARGSSVAIIARDPLELERALTDLKPRATRKNRVIGVVCDLHDGKGINEMLNTVRLQLGPIDVLVNNAGAIQVGPLDAMKPEDFEHEMQLHCYAPMRTMLGVRDDMRRRGGGRIANIASIGGVLSVPHLLPYSASKFALVGLSQGMHAELARDQIVVSTIVPGLMRTGSPMNATFKGDAKREYAWFKVSDSLPLLSMSAQRAAEQIVAALEDGKPYVVLGLSAKLAALAAGLFPGLMTRAMALVTSLMPQSADPRSRFGREAETSLTSSFLTAATRRAALRNNEC